MIKMTIKGRSPTMRHVSRTHRVALDWLFDRINLDSKIQTRYIDTKHQLADIFTKGNFTRDEWNNLPHLFNISHFSSTCCAKNSSLISCSKKMANRVQEQKKEERIVAKSRPTAMKLVFVCSGKFLIREESDYILKSRETHCRRENCKQDEKKFETRRSAEFSSEAGEMYTLLLTKQARGNLWLPVFQKNAGNPRAERKKWPHDFYTSSAVVSHTDKVYSIVRRTYDRGPTDEMDDLYVNAAVWCTPLNTTFQAAVHLGQDHDRNLRSVENQFWSSLKKLFKETENLIKNQTEITRRVHMERDTLAV